jgi:cell division protein FtsB
VLSGRALVLCVVGLVLVLMLAAPVQRYLAHRAAIASAEQLQRTTQQQVDDLQKQSDQWKDPAYVEQQARTRLQYVMPGDTVYQIVPQGSKSSAPASGKSASGGSSADASTLPGDSWNQRLWTSVQGADAAP